MMTNRSFFELARPRVLFCNLVIAAWFISLVPPTAAFAGSVIQIDPFPLINGRYIPDITSTNDSIVLYGNNIIDIVILGDGYLSAESTKFIDDAQKFYDKLCGYSGNPGIRPFNLFREALRVRAVWEPSANRVGAARNSHYRVKLDGSGGVANDLWWDGGSGADRGFRDSLYKSIDSVPSPKQIIRYPATIENTAGGQLQIHWPMRDTFSKLYVVMLLLKGTPSADTTVSGRTRPVLRYGGPEYVRVSFGEGRWHEFGHSFGYLQDEYIDDRGTNINFNNPLEADKTVFNLSNLCYDDTRCDLPWAHLAPGGTYNPDLHSLIGNLYRGGEQDLGVWHSEYKCLINGTHENYFCDLTPDSVRLRDEIHFCFWCEEILALRLLERTNMLERPGDPVDINERGRTWYLLWRDSLREAYYNYFNVESLIVQKNACYALYAGGSCASCSSSCAALANRGMPPCLPGCAIQQVDNAIYVDGAAGAAGNIGSRTSPKNTVLNGINATCSPGRIVFIKAGSYLTPFTASNPAILMPDSCASVIIGK